MSSTNRRPEKLTPRISIVIPARNEARNLEVILPELPAVHQVILVDGGSVDGTIETARRVMPGIEIIQQTRTGKGNALACGFAAVTGDIVIMFDADGSADPAEIPAFVGTLLAGADVAKGSRFCEGGGSEDITRFRQIGNLGLNLITNILLGTRYSDLCYGYNAFWAYTLPRLELPATAQPRHADGRMHWGDGFEIETVLTCRFAAAKLNVVEVPSVERLRIHGESNLRAVSDGFRVLKTIWTERQRSRLADRVSAPATYAPRTESVVLLDMPTEESV
jgi:glycosyltransferase involved in cell wall biosynthesis